jgi:DNA-directed RNA polymerase specialized sigma24 family protein
VAHEQDIESIAGQVYASLCRFALSLTRNEVEACDLTQQTFFRLARRSHQIRDTKKIRCWLYTTLRREFLQSLRTETSHLTIEFRPEIHDIPSFTDEVARALDAKTVLEALSQIEPAFRTPVELFYVGAQEYLAKMNAPRPPELRAALLALPTAGCKAFSWNNQRLSLTCFKLPSGELLHVIVIAENAIPATHFDEHAREQDGWRIKYERHNGLLVIFFSRAPMNEIIQFT